MGWFDASRRNGAFNERPTSRPEAPLNSAIHMTVYTALLVGASAIDVGCRRIPNAVVVPLAVTGCIAQAMLGGGPRVLAGVVAGTIVFALLWFPWKLGFLGGGDLKLAAAAALWLEPHRLPVFVLTAAIAGGVLGVAVRAMSLTRAWRQVRRLRGCSTAIPDDATLGGGADVLPPARAKESIPYALAIATGGLVAVLGWG